MSQLNRAAAVIELVGGPRQLDELLVLADQLDEGWTPPARPTLPWDAPRAISAWEWATAHALAGAYGHEWAEWADELSSLPSSWDDAYRQWLVWRMHRPFVFVGVGPRPTHTTGSARLRWTISRDTAEVIVSRPAGDILRATWGEWLPLTVERLYLDDGTCPVRARHVDALVDALVAAGRTQEIYGALVAAFLVDLDDLDPDPASADDDDDDPRMQLAAAFQEGW